MGNAVLRIGGLAVAAALIFVACTRPSWAVPSFAAQTGQPCTACHIGAFGPQLTPLGRAFKIGGYTQTGGQGPLAKIPLAGFVLNSFTHTNTSQPQPAAPDFGRNNNFALDQISLFLAGRITDYAGAFVQGTYDGVGHTVHLDNTDLRLTTVVDAYDRDLRLGVSVNNGPTVQDPYNSTFAWIFPFASSALAPTPAAQPLLAGGLIGNSIGATTYLWYDESLYLEGGLYNTYGRTLLNLTGATLGPGATANPAPYGRVAYEWNWNMQSAHIGAVALYSNLSPANGERSVETMFGRDSYTDVAIDGGYQFLGDGTNIATIDAIFTHEEQNLKASTALGTSTGPANHLNQARVNMTYFYQNTYGLNLGWQNTWGNANPALFAPQPLSGSANGKPNSNSFIIEADWVPFGKDNSWGRPLANLKLGIQYTIYTLFNGGTKNFDGFGHDASGNNTLFLYAWLAF
ncbi:MAG TPA: hypothetical protein VGM32_04490 [Rhodopila sp.]|jgi:hypothetical protein